MKATAKYFWLVLALLLVQILLGATTAHYQVEGQEFYGFALADWLPYSLTRTWHTQLAVLWIATAWLATGLYIAPAISGHEPKLQRLGVNFLFLCLLVIVVGAFAGQWLAVMQKMGLDLNFWFGHQGWEYVDLGRFWQVFLFVGLMLWLLLVGRALAPALKRRDEMSSIVGLLFLSTIAIGLFYGAGLMWGEKTHLSMVEYWRWWVVHLWVEGFFEVFAVAVMSFLFVKLGLVRGSVATIAVLFATVVFLSGGVLGTFHHLYFAGTTTAIVALGASFSALEVVPLALIGMEAYNTFQLSRATPWMARYRWPIMFFLAVSFWNLVGAGLFGFLINTPLALYYMQGLNLTPLHGHTALFGVYGMLGIGLLLFCVRGLKPDVDLERDADPQQLLDLQCGARPDGAADSVAAGAVAAECRPQSGLLVRALGRVHVPAADRAAGLDAGPGRHDILDRRGAAVLVRVPGLASTPGFADRRCRGASRGGAEELIEFYPEIRLVHSGAALASGGLLLLRGLAGWAGLSIGMAAPARYLGYGIDTVLLTAALMLATMLHRAPLVDPWLTTKVVLVVVYVVLGFRALNPHTSPVPRRRLFLAALAAFAILFTVARSNGSALLGLGARATAGFPAEVP